MATKLFLRDSAVNGIDVFKDMLTTAGSGSATGVVNTTASGTEIQWTQTAGGTVLEWISGRAPAGGFTLAGTMTFSIWAHESNMLANCGARSRVFKRTAAGVESEVGGGPWNDGVEFGTAAAEMVWTGTPTSTVFAEDDRLIVRYYITNIGTMASGHTCTLTYDTADATTGDGFFQITENVTFKANDQTGPVGLSTETDVSLALGGISILPAGMAAETETALALVPVQLAAAGTAIETDAALALGVARPVGMANDNEAALALAAVQIAAVGLASEIDTALALSAPSGTGVGTAVETDSALALGVARPVAIAAETDSALALGAARPAGMAVESNAALALGAGSPVGAALETETAFMLASARPVGLATETAVALALAAVQIRSVGLASETDTALVPQSAMVSGPIGLAAETDDAFALVYWRQYPLEGTPQSSPGNDDQTHPLKGTPQRYPLEAA